MSLKVKFRKEWSSWSSNILAILCVAIFLIGAAFRLSQYIADRSLWFDEALLALNIINRSFSGLAQPLDYNQGAPLGFLLMQKLLTLLLGNADYVLRIFPLICGLSSFWAMYALAKRIFVEHAAVIAAIVLFAFSGSLIFYSSDAKQYSCDVFICLLLLLVIARTLDRNPLNQDFVLLAASGTAAVGFSHPALFILAGGGWTLGTHFILRQDWRSTIKLGCVSRHVLRSGYSVRVSLCGINSQAAHLGREPGCLNSKARPHECTSDTPRHRPRLHFVLFGSCLLSGAARRRQRRTGER
jgi:hypothetical protein